MFKLIGTRQEPLTPELALEFATMPAWEGERPLRPHRCKYLESRILDHQFYNPRWAVAYLDGRKYRVNGQHSSHVLATVNGDFPKGLMALIDEFQCENKNDLAELFGQFDNTISSRPAHEVTNAHARVHPELSHIKPTFVSRILAGIGYALSGEGENRPRSNEERAQLVHSHIPFILWAYPLSKLRHTSKAGVMAAAFSTWNRNQDAAEEFWSMVTEEDHADPRHPTRVLARFLREAVSASDPRIASKRWAPRAFYVKSIHAWNAWRRGENTDLKYRADAPLPKVWT